jgi:hypothetical protein
MGFNDLLRFGVSIDFFGNYRRESRHLTNFTDTFNRGMSRLQGLLIGGGLIYGLNRFVGAIARIGKEMEFTFASLETTLGSQARTMEALAFARRKGVETPFEISEVNQALQRMTMTGFAQNSQMREEVFQAIGDFAGARGFDFGMAMDMIAKASFGNFEQLADRTGFRRQTIRGAADSATQLGKLTAEQRKGLETYIDIIEKATPGTDKFRMALVKVIGALHEGGMEKRLMTVGGALSNVSDIFQNFMFDMIGYTQIQGTLFNRIAATVRETVLGPFDMMSDKFDSIKDGASETMSVMERLGRLARNIGDMLTSIWYMVDEQIGKGTNALIRYAMELDRFFMDYQNNVAPIVLFIGLLKIQMEDFFEGFARGFGNTFGLFMQLSSGILHVYGKIFGLMNSRTASVVNDVGYALGSVLVAMIGMKSVMFLISPLVRIIGLIAAMRNVVIGLNVAMAANPIGLIIVGVAALAAGIYLLIKNFDKIRASISGISDSTLMWVSMFAPIVGIPLLLIKHWDSFKTFFINTGQGIWNWLQTFGIYTKATFKLVFGSIGDSWNWLMDGFKRFGKWVDQNFPIIAQAFRWLGGIMYDFFVKPFEDAWNWLNKMFNSFGRMIDNLAQWSVGFNKNSQEALDKARQRTGLGVQQSDDTGNYSEGLMLRNANPPQRPQPTQQAPGQSVRIESLNINIPEGTQVDGSTLGQQMLEYLDRKGK